MRTRWKPSFSSQIVRSLGLKKQWKTGAFRWNREHSENGARVIAMSFYFEGRPFGEIEAASGLSRATVCRMIRRLRRAAPVGYVRSRDGKELGGALRTVLNAKRGGRKGRISEPLAAELRRRVRIVNGRTEPVIPLIRKFLERHPEIKISAAGIHSFLWRSRKAGLLPKSIRIKRRERRTREVGDRASGGT